MGVIELLRRVGEDYVRVQNVVESMAGIRLKGKRGRQYTEITFGTDAITPSDVMRNDCPMVGLVLWLPRNLVEKAKAEHAAGAPPPEER